MIIYSFWLDFCYCYYSCYCIFCAARPKRRVLPRSDLKFEFVGDSVATTVLDLLLRHTVP